MAEENIFTVPVEALKEGPSEPDPKEPPTGTNTVNDTTENHTPDHIPENTSENASGDPVMQFVVQNFEQINAMYLAFSSKRKEVHPTSIPNNNDHQTECRNTLHQPTSQPRKARWQLKTQTGSRSRNMQPMQLFTASHLRSKKQIEVYQRRFQKTQAEILGIRKCFDESLGDYLQRFGKEMLHLTGRSDGMMTGAFINGLRPGRFFKDLIARPPAMMEFVYASAQLHKSRRSKYGKSTEGLKAIPLFNVELALTSTTTREPSLETWLPKDHSVRTELELAPGPSQKRSRSSLSPSYPDATTFSEGEPVASEEDKEVLISELQDSLAASENEIAVLQLRVDDAEARQAEDHAQIQSILAQYTVYIVAAATVHGISISGRLRVTDRVFEDGHRSKMYKVEPDLICSWEPDLVTSEGGSLNHFSATTSTLSKGVKCIKTGMLSRERCNQFTCDAILEGDCYPYFLVKLASFT
nr:Gag protein [Tanacetum cinerariifolium]